MAGEAAIGGLSYWLSEEVSARVAAGVEDVLGKESRRHNLDPQALPSHIICLPAAYEELREHEKKGVHIVTPLWAVRSAAQGKWQPEEGYSPNPAKFLSGLIVYLDDYPTNIKVVYGALVVHYGGQVSKQLTRHCSHVITDRPVEELETALPIVDEVPIQVYPLKWLDDCIGNTQLISEEPRVAPRPAGKMSQSPAKHLSRDTEPNHQWRMLQLSKAYPGTSKSLDGCAFVLADEYPRSTRSALVDIIGRHGGRVFLTARDATKSFQSSDIYFVCPFLEAVADLGDSSMNVVSEFFVLMSVETRRRIDLDGGGNTNVPVEEAFVRELCTPVRQWGPVDSFTNCVICVSGYNDDSSLTRQIIRRVIERLGGCYVGPLMMNRTTHLIVGDDGSEKLQRAKQWIDAGVPLHIVSLQWLLACVQNWERVDESQFVWDLLNDQPEQHVEVITVPEARSDGTPSRSAPRTSTGDLFNSPLIPSQFQYDVDSIPTPEIPQIAQTPQSQDEKLQPAQRTASASKSSELGKRTRGPPSPITNQDTAPSPKRPAILDLEAEQEIAMDEHPAPALPQPIYRRFMLSAAGAEQKEEVAEAVLQLGAEISDTIGDYDDDCTHIILTELKRTPKFLFGCAGGKWILRPEYIDQCQKAGQWLPEEDFEWSAPDGGPEVDPKTGLWLGAARTWRLAAATGQGPFSGMQITVVGKTAPPRDQLERLVQVGKGSVASIEEIVTPEDSVGMRLVIAKEDTNSIHDTLVLAQSTGCVLVKPSFLLDLISMKARPDPVDPKYAVVL